MTKKYLVYRAFHFFQHGEPLPVDTYMALNSIGIKPERLMDRFEAGELPADILDPQTGIRVIETEEDLHHINSQLSEEE